MLVLLFFSGLLRLFVIIVHYSSHSIHCCDAFWQVQDSFSFSVRLRNQSNQSFLKLKKLLILLGHPDNLISILNFFKFPRNNFRYSPDLNNSRKLRGLLWNDSSMILHTFLLWFCRNFCSKIRLLCYRQLLLPRKHY